MNRQKKKKDIGEARTKKEENEIKRVKVQQKEKGNPKKTWIVVKREREARTRREENKI